MTYIVAIVPDSFPGSLPHHQQVHLRPPRTLTVQALSAAICRLAHLSVPVDQRGQITELRVSDSSVPPPLFPPSKQEGVRQRPPIRAPKPTALWRMSALILSLPLSRLLACGAPLVQLQTQLRRVGHSRSVWVGSCKLIMDGEQLNIINH